MQAKCGYSASGDLALRMRKSLPLTPSAPPSHRGAARSHAQKNFPQNRSRQAGQARRQRPSPSFAMVSDEFLCDTSGNLIGRFLFAAK
jgi:hypothetical protein